MNSQKSTEQKRFTIFRTDTDKENSKWLHEEVLRGRLRQGWGKRGLRLLTEHGAPIDKEEWETAYREVFEKEASSKRFGILTKMLELRKGSIVVMPKMPGPGKFTVALVSGTYDFKLPQEYPDFGHIVPVEPNNVRSFDRNENDQAAIVSSVLFRTGGGNTDAVSFCDTPETLSAVLQLLEMPSIETEKPTRELVSEPETPYRTTNRTMHPLNTILYGPPGTGKTWHTVTRTVAIIENRDTDEVEKEKRKKVKRQFEEYRDSGHIEMVTFHQNATYEDFIEGIRPVLTETDQAQAKDQTGANGQASPDRSSPRDIQYEMRPGVFRRIAKRALEHPDQRYVLVIDEINRGNIPRIFGELITLIEDTKRKREEDEARVTLPGSQEEFSVPSNLYILGTMNTANRSIALLDTALRRRFTFEEMMPNPSHKGVNKTDDNVDCGKLLKAINRRIAVLLDRDHQIGHTYFLGVDTTQALAKAFQHSIMPLLQEYFYDDWAKIQAVLNDNGFVDPTDPPNELQANLADPNQKVYNLLPPNDKQWTTPKAYQAIYDKTASPSSADNKPNDGAAASEAEREAQAGPEDRTPGTIADRKPQND